MPIYVYKCGSCGFVEEKLQKLSDPQPKVCSSCGAAALAKQVTAAGFELKGTGWYVTDFRNEGGGHGSKESAANVPSHSAGDAAHADGASAKSDTPSAPAAKAAAPATKAALAKAPSVAPAAS